MKLRIFSVPFLFFAIFRGTCLAEEFRICLTWTAPGFTNTYANKTRFYFRANPQTAHYIILSSTDGIIYRGTIGKYIEVSGNNLSIEGIGSYPPPLKIKTTCQISIFPSVRRADSVNWRTYRGYFELRVSAGYVMIINVVPLEQYLYGVVPNEIGHTSPREALKAQAVCARTAAYGKRGTAHTGQPFDLCSIMHCQVYGSDSNDRGGRDTERSSTNIAVDDTRGVVIKYGGNIASWVNYFSCCGGRTANNEDVWGGTAVAYLRSVVCDPDKTADANDSDDFCYHPTVNEYPFYYWTYSISSTTLLAKLTSYPATAPANPNATLKPNGIAITQTDISGRAKQVTIYYSNETKHVSGNHFRAAVGYNQLKSTRFSVNYNPPNYNFIDGKGFGHGVGMCQNGVIGMAQMGYSYDNILKFYFTGITLISPPRISHIPPSGPFEGNTEISLSATVTADVGRTVKSVLLYYRTSGVYAYKSLPMTFFGNNVYNATIPSTDVIPPAIEYYIYAEDNGGLSSTYPPGGANEPVKLTVNPKGGPEIYHTGITTATVYTTIVVTATVKDINGVASVYLFYKQATSTMFSSSSMTHIGNNVFSGNIPPEYVVYDGVDYYIKAEDTKGNVSYCGTEQLPFRIKVYSGIDDTSPPIFGEPTVTPSKPKRTDNITIIVYITDDKTGAKKSELHYRNKTEPNFNVIPMNQLQNNIYAAIIPASKIISNCIYYYITAIDYNDNLGRYPATYYTIDIQDEPPQPAQVILTPFGPDESTRTLFLNFPTTPNPHSDKLILRIFNIKGINVKTIEDKSVFENDSSNNTVIVRWEVSKDLPAGIYLYTVEKNNSVIKSGKVVIAK